MLGAAAVLVLEGGQDQLVALEAALLHAGERWGRGFPPLGDEYDEGQGLWRALEQFLWEGPTVAIRAWPSSSRPSCSPPPTRGDTPTSK